MCPSVKLKDAEELTELTELTLPKRAPAAAFRTLGIPKDQGHQLPSLLPGTLGGLKMFKV